MLELKGKKEAAGDKSWEDVKKDTDRATDELADAFDRTLSRFK